jgi:hypothetical protein
MFRQPGRYSILALFWEKWEVPVSMEVKAPAPEDESAIRYLDEHPLYVYFVAESTQKVLLRRLMNAQSAQALTEGWGKDDPSRQLEDFRQTFPTSRYAKWAQLAQLNVRAAPLLLPFHTGIGTDNKDPLALRAVGREYEKIAPTLPAPWNGEAWYEAGVIATVTNYPVAAEKLFKHAVETNADATMDKRIQHFKHWLESIDEIPRFESDILFKRAVDELKAQRYDVARFRQDYPEEYVEYSNRISKLLTRLDITDTERNFQTAELLRYYITKYTKPLSAEEWSRRYPATAPTEKSQPK